MNSEVRRLLQCFEIEIENQGRVLKMLSHNLKRVKDLLITQESEEVKVGDFGKSIKLDQTELEDDLYLELSQHFNDNNERGKRRSRIKSYIVRALHFNLHRVCDIWGYVQDRDRNVTEPELNICLGEMVDKEELFHSDGIYTLFRNVELKYGKDHFEDAIIAVLSIMPSGADELYDRVCLYLGLNDDEKKEYCIEYNKSLTILLVDGRRFVDLKIKDGVLVYNYVNIEEREEIRAKLLQKDTYSNFEVDSFKSVDPIMDYTPGFNYRGKLNEFAMRHRVELNVRSTQEGPKHDVKWMSYMDITLNGYKYECSSIEPCRTLKEAERIVSYNILKRLMQV